MLKLEKFNVGQDVPALKGSLKDYDKVYVIGDIHGMHDYGYWQLYV